MAKLPPSIVVAEKVRDGIVIEFSDGKCAYFDSEFLHQSLDMVEPLEPIEDERHVLRSSRCRLTAYSRRIGAADEHATPRLFSAKDATRDEA